MLRKSETLRKLCRSVIFTPADRPQAMKKAVTSLDVDVVVLDLEDAVSPESKVQGRKNVIEFLSLGPFPRCQIIVRCNCPQTTEWGIDDIAGIMNSSFDALLLPKVEDESTIETATKILGGQQSRGMTKSMIALLVISECKL